MLMGCGGVVLIYSGCDEGSLVRRQLGGGGVVLIESGCNEGR